MNDQSPCATITLCRNAGRDTANSEDSPTTPFVVNGRAGGAVGGVNRHVCNRNALIILAPGVFREIFGRFRLREPGDRPNSARRHRPFNWRGSAVTFGPLITMAQGIAPVPASRIPALEQIAVTSLCCGLELPVQLEPDLARMQSREQLLEPADQVVVLLLE